MHLRARYRLSAVPLPLVATCAGWVVALLALLVIGPVRETLASDVPALPWVVFAATLLAPVTLFGWYTSTFADVRHGTLSLRTLAGTRLVDLRRLVAVDVHPKSASDSLRSRHELLLRLQDQDGRELWLPLNAWRDEELLMARVLRGTVESRIKIDGDPGLVRRFSSLLATYRSWDRQQAAA